MTGRTATEAPGKVTDLPNGPAAAAILASGLGVFFLGFLTTLNEMAVGVHDWLSFQDRVGPLSGKTTMACVAWLVSWALLSLVLWRRDVPLAAVLLLTGALIVVGNVFMFPPVFERLAVE
jgi:hypothetical protein